MRILSIALEEVGMSVDQSKTQFICVGEWDVERVRIDFKQLEDDENEIEDDETKKK